MLEADAMASVLVDQAVVAMLMPWPCPSPFGPDGRYCLEELVGAGRSSLVYRATDLKLSSEGFPAVVAIKISRRGENDPAEALTTRRINHPNVIRVIDRGVEPGGSGYVVTEYVQGGDLQGRLGPWEPSAAAQFMAKLARAVHAAHSAGVMHCDLKPANVLLTPEGEPKLADFDLSRSVVADSTVTRGNIAFMSPEQFAGDPQGLTPPSDVYALGGMFFHLLTGRMPNGDTPEEVAESHRCAIPPTKPDVAEDLDRICTRAMARNRDERYESAAAMAGDLERWLGHQPLAWGRTPAPRRVALWCKRRPYHAAATAGLLVLLGAATVVVTVLIRSAERERQTQIAAQAETIRKTNEQMELLKGKVRTHIRSIAGGLMGRLGDLQEQMLPMLTWLQWLADTPVISTEGEVALAPKRAEALRYMIAVGEKEQRGSDLDIRMARYALAYFQVFGGESAAAAELIPRVRADWPGLRGDDPMTLSIEALEACARAELEADRSLSDRLGELAKVREKLEHAGTAEPARRLVVRVAGRMEKNSSSSTSPH
jgi:hypothetical protein